MKKMNGFTLVELLAVILILGIIALIAIPSVIKIQREVKDNATRLNAKNYVSAVENTYAVSLRNGNVLNDGVYYVNKESDAEGTQITGVNLKGTQPTGIDDYIVLEKGNVIEYELTIDDNVVLLSGEEVTVVKAEDIVMLPTPTFTMSELNITVTSPTTNVLKYVVYANNNSIGEFLSSSPVVNISTLSGYNLVNGTDYSITIKAIPGSPTYRDSSVSTVTIFKAFTYETTMIYENGNQYNVFTGGWTGNVGLRNGNWYSYPGVINADHMYLVEGLYYGLWAQSAVRTSNMQNYHDYYKLVIDYETSGAIDYSFFAQISTSTSLDYTSFYMFEEARAFGAGRRTREIMLSSVYNGAAYLKIDLVTGNERPNLAYDNLKIYKIYLVKKIES